ncbi:VCBS repeat-containing protein [Nannocystis pusilla]|uniref:VCBS repeat-containing protein n=2 Tax=Nannocystis pusilla TaxID=889268 RepID=A0ABS7U5J4_9BACT|nr:VCBS repeat-containing protein [Nannocystis pusilla]
MADFDGDGIDDIAAYLDPNGVESQTWGVGVLRGLGDGTYAMSGHYPTGYDWGHSRGSWSVVVADFDGDGDPDIVSADGLNEQLHVLANDGDGTFTDTTYPTLPRPTSVLAADFDGDGEIDLATLHEEGEVLIQLNLGGGTYGPGAVENSQSEDHPLRPFVTGDIDGDGDLDLLVTAYMSDLVIALPNDGDGNFAAPKATPVGDRPTSLALADFDQDGNLDLAVGHGDPLSVGIHRGAGGGDFAAEVEYVVDLGGDWHNITVADLDADGHLDIASTDPEGDIYTLRNLGDGTFVPHGHFLGGSRSIAIAVADADVDGRPDLLVSNLAADSFSVLLQNADTSFGAVPPRIDGAVGKEPFIADLSGDGVADILINGWNAARILVGAGDGSFALAGVHPLLSNGTDPQLVDLDGDGLDEFVFTGHDGIGVLHNLGGGDFERVNSPSGGNASQLDLFDYDNDGRRDGVLIRSGTIALMHGEPGVAFTLAGALPSLGNPQSIEVGDFDEDGRIDLLIVESPDFQPDHVRLFRNDGGGQFTPHIVHTTDYFRSARVADLDADGHLDLVVVAEYETEVFRGLGDGQLQPTGKYTITESNADIVYPLDLDGDGVLDFFVPDLLIAEFTVLRGLGGAAYAAPEQHITHVTASYERVLPLDLDGDSDLDFFFAGRGVSTVLNQGDGTFAPTRAYRIGSAQGAAVGELDGDGRPDFVVTSYEGTYLLRSNCR